MAFPEPNNTQSIGPFVIQKPKTLAEEFAENHERIAQEAEKEKLEIAKNYRQYLLSQENLNLGDRSRILNMSNEDVYKMYEDEQKNLERQRVLAESVPQLNPTQPTLINPYPGQSPEEWLARREQQEKDAIIWNRGMRQFGYSNLSDRQAARHPEMVSKLADDAKADIAGKVVVAGSLIPGMQWLRGASPFLYYGANAAMTAGSAYDWYKHGPNFWNVSGTLLGGADIALPLGLRAWNNSKIGQNYQLNRALNEGLSNYKGEEIPLNVGWGPKQTLTATHAKNSPTMPSNYFEGRWDVVNEGANPLGAWFQGNLGIPRTIETGATPEKALKAAKARNLFATRPVKLKGDLTLEKPLVTVGDVSDRSALSWQAERMGADGIIYNGVYDNGYAQNQVILGFNPEGSFNLNARRIGVIPFAERLGIPKADRNNLNKFQKDALFDLEQYINSGQYRQIPIVTEDGFVWGNTGIPIYKYFQEKGLNNWFGLSGFNGTFEVSPRSFGVGVGYNNYRMFPKASEFDGGRLGEATMFSGSSGYNKILLTAPRTSATKLIAETPEEELLVQKAIEQSSPRISKEIMKDFWRGVQKAMRPGNYLSGDERAMPLGFQLINKFKAGIKGGFGRDNNRNNLVLINNNSLYERILNSLLTKQKWSAGDTGLSTDSYLAILKQAAREGSPYELRYSPQGFNEFNNQSIDNKFISDLLIQAKNGEIPQEDFIKAFHDWVAPYGGMDAKIVNGEIVIPHPFLYMRKHGGKL